MANIPNFMGQDGFYWFQGVCEDRQDPKKLGRVRVRVLGLHTSDKNYIPTQDLPWAYILQPVNSGAMTGIGQDILGILPGTWCFGFWRDGSQMQEPVIIGTFGGIPEEATQKPTGFYDPRDDDKLVEKLETAPRKVLNRIYNYDGTGIQLTFEQQAYNYPRTQNPTDNVLYEPDTNRLARNDPEEFVNGVQINQPTIIDIKNQSLDTSVPISFEGNWSEPESPYNAEYPFNHVTESESGHIKEVDDTPNNERTHEWNRTGCFTEIGPDGTKVMKAVWDNYEIVMRDDYIHICGVKNQTVHKEYNLYVQGDWNIQVDGNVNMLVKGSVYEHVEGNVESTVDGNIHIKTGSDETHMNDGNTTFSTGGKFSINAAEVDIIASGNVNIDSDQTWINSGKANTNVAPQPILPKVE